MARSRRERAIPGGSAVKNRAARPRAARSGRCDCGRPRHGRRGRSAPHRAAARSANRDACGDRAVRRVAREVPACLNRSRSAGDRLHRCGERGKTRGLEQRRRGGDGRWRACRKYSTTLAGGASRTCWSRAARDFWARSSMPVPSTSSMSSSHRSSSVAWTLHRRYAVWELNEWPMLCAGRVHKRAIG